MARNMSTWVTVDCTVKLSEEEDGAQTVQFASDSGLSFEVRDIRQGQAESPPQWFGKIEHGDRVSVSYMLESLHCSLKVEKSV